MSGEKPSISPEAWCNYQQSLIPPLAECMIVGVSAILVHDDFGAPWLLAEDIEYEPMTPSDGETHMAMTATSEYPFHTYGEQWFVDLDRALFVHEPHFEAVEGQIQGIVYAIEGMMGQGLLRPSDYKRYLQQLLSVKRDEALQVLEASDILEITKRAKLD